MVVRVTCLELQVSLLLRFSLVDHRDITMIKVRLNLSRLTGFGAGLSCAETDRIVVPGKASTKIQIL